MSAQNESKLKHLLSFWPIHTVAPLSWLGSQGYSRFLIRRYVESRWLKRFEYGSVIRADDKVDWRGAVWGLQQIHKSVHVGGKTALELQGKAHFVKFKETKIFLFSGRGVKLPKWLKEKSSEWEFILRPTNLFPPNIGLEKVDCGEFTISTSNLARAFCEYLYLTEKFHSYEEAVYLMENLQFLDSTLMQEALENCTSIRVKRLVLCLAKLQNVKWYKKLNLATIELGRGKRQGVKNGLYDPEFLITYPRIWKDDESESVF